MTVEGLKSGMKVALSSMSMPGYLLTTHPQVGPQGVVDYERQGVLAIECVMHAL